MGLFLAGCDFPRPNAQDVVLTDKPVELGPVPKRFSGEQPLKVKGLTSELCLVLADDVPDKVNEDAVYERLMHGADVRATLNATDGRAYQWKCNGWSHSVLGQGAGNLSACFRLECNQTPPVLRKGTEIASVDIRSDRPLNILGVKWSSTDSFDHVSQPRPDLFARSSEEYEELERDFGGKRPWSLPGRTALRVELTSNRRKVSHSHFNSTLMLRLSEAGVQLEPTSQAFGMGTVTIPTAAVGACSMRCFGPQAKEALLLLPGPGIEVSFLNAPEVVAWCWERRVPMLSRDRTSQWSDYGRPLPARDPQAEQFQTREAYDRQAERTCAGY